MKRAGRTRGRSVLRVWALFLAVFGAQMALFSWADPWLTPRVNHWTAVASGWALSLCGVEARVDDVTVHNPLGTFRVVWECTGVTPIALLLAGLLAYPSSWRAKAIGVGLGVPAILLINQVRLVTLVFIGHWWPSVEEVAHLVVWQTLIVLVTVVLWLAWVLRIAERHESAAA